MGEEREGERSMDPSYMYLHLFPWILGGIRMLLKFSVFSPIEHKKYSIKKALLNYQRRTLHALGSFSASARDGTQ